MRKQPVATVEVDLEDIKALCFECAGEDAKEWAHGALKQQDKRLLRGDATVCPSADRKRNDCARLPGFLLHRSSSPFAIGSDLTLCQQNPKQTQFQVVISFGFLRRYTNSARTSIFTTIRCVFVFSLLLVNICILSYLIISIVIFSCNCRIFIFIISWRCSGWHQAAGGDEYEFGIIRQTF